MKTYSGEPMYLAIDQKRLLRELPAFFKSFGDAITELIQNAYRANASEVKIVVNHITRELTFEDNGRGAPDPRPLITAGMTGWNEEVVTDPAGLGLFALLGLSEEVTIESRAEGHKGWKIVVNRACFDGVPIHTQISEYYEGPSHGVRIHAQINEKASLALVTRINTLDNFRHVFPLHVTLTEITVKGEEITEYPPPKIETPYVDSTAGKFYIYPYEKDYYSNFSAEPKVIWEHRVLSDTGINKDLRDSLCKFPKGVYVANLLKGKYVWVVSPETGIRPKLPDRRELIHNEPYKEAINSLARSIYNAFDIDRVIEKLNDLGLPEVIKDKEYESKIREVSSSLHPIFKHDYGTLMRLAGYKTCSYADYSSFYFYSTGDETNSDISTAEYRVKNPIEVGDVGIAEAMCRCGKWALARGENATELNISNIRIAEFEGLHFGVCDSIEVFVNKKLTANLPYICDTDNIDKELLPEVLQDSDGFYLVTEIGLAAFIDGMGEDRPIPPFDFMPWLIYALYNNNHIGEYVTDWIDGTIEDIYLLNEARIAAYAAFFPKLTWQQSRYSKLCNLANELSIAKSGTQSLEWTTNRLIEEYPDLENSLTPILKGIEALKNAGINPADWAVRNLGEDTCKSI